MKKWGESMFIDKVKIEIKAGSGGKGMIAFHREKFVERGGPSGGDGGKGGSIYFIADSGISTLLDFKYKKKIIGNDGEKGAGKNCYGRDAEDVYIKVPIGTLVIDADSRRVIADFKKKDQVELIAKGGRGGRGNAKFASSVNQVPRIAENGEKGQEFTAILELKLLADAGLVGFPSVGKSTLLSVVSNAKPEIADYHFTTIVPNLGIVKVPDGRSFVMADLPGLIEGAHLGKGLGLRFLRHIERCRVLIHVIDISNSEGRDPIDDFEKINLELKEYGMNLTQRPMVVAANKMDDPAAILLLDEFRKKYSEKFEIFPISALTTEGIHKLLYRVADLLETTPEFSLIDENKLNIDHKIFEFKGDDKGFVISRPKTNYWVISGERVEKLYHMTNISTDEGLLYLTTVLRKMGVERELIELGVQEGDIVKLCDFEFEFYS